MKQAWQPWYRYTIHRLGSTAARLGDRRSAQCPTSGHRPYDCRLDYPRSRCDRDFSGGSTIDTTKAAEVLRTLGDHIEDSFGTGLVSRAPASSNSKLTSHVAIQTTASSSAHLTKYSSITDLATAQKKLIVDEAIVPVLKLVGTFLGAARYTTADIEDLSGRDPGMAVAEALIAFV